MHIFHNSRFVFSLLLFLLFSFVSAFHPPYCGAGETNISIAVLDLEVGKDVSVSLLRPLTERLREELFNTGKYRILDRKNMEKILVQQGINLSDCTSSECAVNVGQLLSVDKIVTGSVSKVEGVISSLHR